MSAESFGPDRLPPQSRDAERCVLGSMLRDNAVIPDVINIVRADNFYFDAHQKIYSGITRIFDDGKPVDLVILAEHLRSEKQLEDVGNYAYLAELWEAAPTAANAEYYARIVREKGITRSLIHATTEILRDAYDQAYPADQLLENAERQILEIAELGTTGQTADLQTALDEAYARIDARSQHAYTRVSGTDKYLIVLNFSTDPVNYKVPNGIKTTQLVISNLVNTADIGDTLHMRPWEARIYKF